MTESSPEESLAGSPARTDASEPLHPLPPTPLAESGEKKEKSDLALRLFTAVILIPLVLYVIVLGGLAFLGTVLAFGLLAQAEFYRMIEEEQHNGRTIFMSSHVLAEVEHICDLIGSTVGLMEGNESVPGDR